MRRLKLFAKFFLYTLGVMLLIVLLTHGLIYLLLPRMQLEVGTKQDAGQAIVFSVNQARLVAQAVQRALPVTLTCSLLSAAVCSLLLSRAIAGTIEASPPRRSG